MATKSLDSSNKDFFNLKKIILFVWIIWTILVFFSAYSFSSKEKSKTRELAQKEAVATFNKDQAFRLWATTHGGVYVPITDKTPPNPYLKNIPERDIETPSGKKLTLMNPAYMLRQVMANYLQHYRVHRN